MLLHVSASDPVSEWPQRPLGTVAERIFLGLGDARRRGDGDERELPLLSVRDLHDGHVPPAGHLAKRAVPMDADVERYTVRAEDVVLTCRGTQLKVAIVTRATEGALISSNLIAIRSGPHLLPAVLLAFLQSPTGQQALAQRGRSSTSSLSLTPKAVGALSIPVPPLAVQRQIAELVTAADGSYVAAIRAAEQRRAIAQAVAVELFRGQPRLGQEERTW